MHARAIKKLGRQLLHSEPSCCNKQRHRWLQRWYHCHVNAFRVDNSKAGRCCIQPQHPGQPGLMPRFQLVTHTSQMKLQLNKITRRDCSTGALSQPRRAATRGLNLQGLPPQPQQLSSHCDLNDSDILKLRSADKCSVLQKGVLLCSRFNSLGSAAVRNFSPSQNLGPSWDLHGLVAPTPARPRCTDDMAAPQMPFRPQQRPPVLVEVAIRHLPKKHPCSLVCTCLFR
eukprot:364190-Chlamydomonas_euryale.AAC.4